MMFRFDTLREEWFIVAMIIGIALVLYFVIFGIDLEKPRKKKQDKPEEYETNYLSIMEGLPWSLRIAAVVIVIFMVVYLIEHINHPNSW